MERKSRAVASALALALCLPLAALAQTFGAALTPSAEVPPVVNDGSGVTAVTVNGTSITFSIFVKGISTPTQAHIHRGASTVSGPVVIDFNRPTFTNGLATGTVTTTSALAAELLANPSGFYVNVHTAEQPSGAIRGQLGGTPYPTATFVTSLSAAGEAPAPGAPDGGGVAHVTISGTTVTYTLVVHGLPTQPTASHIHRGVQGTTGPVVVGFPGPFVNGVSTGTTTTTAAIANEILANPSGFYVNAHTAEFPGGAVRGVLNPASPVTVYVPTVVKAAGVNGASFTSDLRIINPTLIPASVTIELFAAATTAAGNDGTTTITVPPGAQTVINDALGNLFGASGLGSLRITSNLPVVVSSRVLNDLRSSGSGTTGLLVPAASLSEAPINGTLALLSNASADDVAHGHGFRTNVGYFNPTTNPVKVTFRARRSDGTTFATTEVTALAYARVQLPVFDLITANPGDRAQSDFYISYAADGPIFVYAAVADNSTGDGYYTAGVNPR